jgi:DNA-binding transcriptional regulator YdaS (Cro superfamily)
MLALPLQADPAQPAAAPAAKADFGQYLADHQADLTPFFSRNADALVKQALPLVMGLLGWLVLATVLIGWFVDVLFSRVYAYFFAPAFSRFKRSIIYASGSLFLSFVYAFIVGLIIVFCLGLSHAVLIVGLAMTFFVVLAFAAQLVWILFLYRTEVPISVAFYLVVLVAHVVLGVLIAGPLIGPQAIGVAANFVDQAITPKLQAEVESKKRELAAAESDRDVARDQVTNVQNQMGEAAIEQDRLSRDIEAKRNSDIYVFSQIAATRAQGDMNSARDRFTAFLTRYPASPLNAAARTQLTQITDQLTAQAAQSKQQQIDTARTIAQARADLLARAGKGQVTLSEMREALLGQSRAQVKDLLGVPSATASDSWRYQRQMIVNPMTNEKHGLTVYFMEGAVQGVDYDSNWGTR